MSLADDPPGRDESEPQRAEPPQLGRRRGRAIIVGAVLGAAAFVIAFMLLVSQCGTDDNSDTEGRAGTAVTSTA